MEASRLNELAGKVAIVTGASKGIGAAIAKALAEAGARVVANYASSKEDAARVVGDIIANGGSAIAAQADVSRSDDVQRLFAETKKALGPVDVLVNNAGVFDFQPIETVTEREFHREFDTNVLGPIFTIQEALKHFGHEGGSIINISSIASVNPVPNSLIYAATKSALDSITRVLARELGPRKIRVNTVAPGGTETEGSRRIGLVGSDLEKQMIAATPLGRFGQPRDIAPVVVFLASNAAAWLTGERITVSGGLR